MYSENLLKSLVLTSALVTSLVSAAPAEVACDKISTYTTEVGSYPTSSDYWLCLVQY